MYSNRIKEYRKEKGMTLVELAEQIGISTGYLCHLENGSRSNPSTKVMEKISSILGKTVAEVFFHGSDNLKIYE